MCKVVDVSQDAETEESSLRPTGMVIYLGKSVTVPKGSTSTVVCLPDGQSSQSKANTKRMQSQAEILQAIWMAHHWMVRTMWVVSTSVCSNFLWGIYCIWYIYILYIYIYYILFLQQTAFLWLCYLQNAVGYPQKWDELAVLHVEIQIILCVTCRNAVGCMCYPCYLQKCRLYRLCRFMQCVTLRNVVWYPQTCSVLHVLPTEMLCITHRDVVARRMRRPDVMQPQFGSFGSVLIQLIFF